MKNVYFILLFLMASCASLPTSSVTYSSYKKIGVAAGPEDILVDTITAKPRLLISCDERREGITKGSIWMYDFDSKASKELQLILPSSDYSFHPHGMSILSKNGNSYLFVINHISKKEDEIIRFRLFSDSLVHEKSFKEGFVGYPNDLYAVDLDEIYYSDYKMFGGSLVHISGATYTKLITHLNMPNGVHVINNSNSMSVYVSTTLENKIYQCKKGKDCKWEKTKIAKIKGGDNFEWYNDSLIVASHSRFIKFLKHEKNSEKYSPSIVYLMHPETGEKKVVFSDDGSIISACSTGLIYKGKLYLGQVFEPFVMVCSTSFEN